MTCVQAKGLTSPCPLFEHPTMQRHTISLGALENHVDQIYFESPWMSIDQDHLSQFAYASYLDPKFADLTASRNNPLGSTLVDGFLLLSMLTYFHFNNSPVAEEGLYGFNYGMDRVRFTHPVFVGDQIRCIARLTKVERRPDGTALVWTDNTIEIENKDKPAMVACWLSLFATRDKESKPAA